MLGRFLRRPGVLTNVGSNAAAITAWLGFIGYQIAEYVVFERNNNRMEEIGEEFIRRGQLLINGHEEVARVREAQERSRSTWDSYGRLSNSGSSTSFSYYNKECEDKISAAMERIEILEKEYQQMKKDYLFLRDAISKKGTGESEE